ncbi:MAG: ATP--guanido phosphotransferase [Planctomycetes bacterium]|nr:ATP--guanido phosphotransferase [Planctomycetota bacterium]
MTGDPIESEACGPQSDVVVRSRIRLARNLAGFPFVGRASDAQRHEVMQLVTRASQGEGLAWVNMAQTSPEERQLLVERHLVSRHFAESPVPRTVGIDPGESLSVMVNEEDHLRIQTILPGLRLREAFDRAHAFDDAVEGRVDFAFSSRWGYLTACPTNVGCGLRVGVMLHLPGLRYTGEMERVKRAAKDMHLAVRGFYGEGSEAVGNLYQVSNQVTLGSSEDDLLHRFAEETVPQLVDYERSARRLLLESNRPLLEDKVHRAIATLRAARLLGAEEATKLLANVRLGICMAMLPDLGLDMVQRLMLQVQPAHLARLDPAAADEDKGRLARAALVRKALRN